MDEYISRQYRKYNLLTLYLQFFIFSKRKNTYLTISFTHNLLYQRSCFRLGTETQLGYIYHHLVEFGAIYWIAIILHSYRLRCKHDVCMFTA